MLLDWIAKRFCPDPQESLRSSWGVEVRSSRSWLEYFTANADAQPDLPWQDGAQVTEAELAEIVDSLRAWQLGETSEGTSLRVAARRYADKYNDPDFALAIDAFIKEEQRHGETLGRFLDQVGVPRAKSDWGDTLFRKARAFLGNMETWTTPVAMIEVHALIYYNAIRQATKSPLLRAICAQILREEVPHIRFQCERLAILHKDRPRWLRALTMLGHRVFFTGITLAIWIGHRRALRAGGYGFGRFWESVWTKMNNAWRLMDPAEYRWAPECAAVAHAY